ncbi:MAG TPA: RluA family pseudouridine synthase [Pyrinomonadaceae bacterium]|jgi:23S rRNA pseudouridine1911/1915/1917 synthase
MKKEGFYDKIPPSLFLQPVLRERMEQLEFKVEQSEADERLDSFLASQLGWLSRMRINSLVLQGACRVNKEVAAPGYHVQSGDRVEIIIDENGPTAMTPEDIPLEVRYEDAHLLVIDKPAGMLVHPTRTEKSGTLANALAYHLNRAALDESNASGERNASMVRPGLVHRLDRATSGLMVVATTARSLSILTRHFHRRLVEKRYIALVHGRIDEDELTIEAPIGRDASTHPKWNVSADGKPSETKLRVVERRASATLVELEPVTGRTNQLRIHCAHIGHAIMGDDWYARDSVQRLCLHAALLGFHHPRGGDWLEFSSPLPAEFLHLLNESVPL